MAEAGGGGGRAFCDVPYCALSYYICLYSISAFISLHEKGENWPVANLLDYFVCVL